MKIEAVTVSVNYSDFLAHSLPLNKPHFNKIIVVTDEYDQRTYDLCTYHHVECIKSNFCYFDDVAFNKANLIIEGLRKLDLDDWVLHLDADIVLPPRFRELVQKIDLDPTCIYGFDRLMCPTFEAWMEHVDKPALQHSQETFIQGNEFPLGVRLGRLGIDGYVPLGYGQLWNAGKTGIKDYPNKHGHAGRTDMLHALRWSRAKRVLIPEIFATHLESAKIVDGMGTNWRGRQTKHFGPGSSMPELCGKTY